MSDSDDDAAFASADEGEEEKSSQAKGNNSKTDTAIKDSKSEKDVSVKVDSKNPDSQQDRGATGKGKKKGKQANKKSKSSEKQVTVETKTKKTEVKSSEKIEKTEDESNTIQPSQEEVKPEKPEKKEEKPNESSQTETTTEPEKAIEESVKDDKPKDKETLVKSPSGQNIERESPNDEKPDIKSALDQLTDDKEEEQEEPKSWGWGGWGSSILNVAQTSVSTFTNQVGEGFSTIMDTMENTLGAIPPEELAFMKTTKEEKPDDDEQSKEITEQPKSQESKEEEHENKEKQKKSEEEVEEKTVDLEKSEEAKEDTASGGGGGWFSSWGVSSLKEAVTKTSNIVQSTSKNLVTGGIDVLETVGKKAFDFIEDHDPGIHKSKEVLFDRGDKPNLSQILKEAKESADYQAEMEKESEEARKSHFGFLFDEFQGISHLEALEILSNQCEKKVQVLLSSLPAETLMSIKSQLIEIKQIFEHENDDYDDDEEQEHEFIKVMTELLTDLHLGTTPNKINRVHESIRKEITDFYEKQEKNETVEPKVMHQKAIQSLAELTSKAMEQFHKAGELILIQKDSDKNFVDRAKCLLSINKLLSTEVSILSTKFSHCLNKLGEDLEDDSCINQMVTNVYLEASNSSTYIHDGFQLLLPCLQQAAIENTPGITE